MEPNISLANRIQEVLLNGKWIANTNFQEQLDSVNWLQATKKVENLNTIALLTFHINYYLHGIINVFKGGNLEIKDKFSFDLAPINTEAEWCALKNEFKDNAILFANYVQEMDTKKLHQVFVEEKYGSYQRNIEAVIEHSYYHLGQVVLIRKIIASNNQKS
jgi:uncharacterized damage-inducible protein DinB